ncbi:hypothetical protein QJS10_CPB04g00939 [Acorus calamus]|uniref:Uncharacterized protein n=1 Tax=Acorus calamus TaxID=4465 RepID=A0AAV9F1T1_ACOCL|nr:hypothetical protein QJS10_CPB04g00939 [Acorus calamus]
MKGKKSSRLLRLALCWARKVVAFDLLSPPDDDGIIRRGDRELSFEEEETTIFRFKKARARHGRMRMSCMNAPPEVELDMEEEEEEEEEERFERDWGEEEEWVDEERESCEVMEEEEEEEIDSRAEEFIKRFHEQLRMQRQSSYLQYSEMIQRSAS